MLISGGRNKPNRTATAIGKIIQVLTKTKKKAKKKEKEEKTYTSGGQSFALSDK